MKDMSTENHSDESKSGSLLSELGRYSTVIMFILKLMLCRSPLTI